MSDDEVIDAVTAKLRGELYVGARVLFEGRCTGTISAPYAAPVGWWKVTWDENYQQLAYGPYTKFDLQLL